MFWANTHPLVPALKGGEIEKSVFFARFTREKHAEKLFLPLTAALLRDTRGCTRALIPSDALKSVACPKGQGVEEAGG
jgi:hypothetical protein